MSVTLESLQEEIVTLHSEIHLLQRQQSSRKGDVGARGETGATGAAGRDAVLIVKQDAETNVVHVFDEAGNEKAQLVALPGPRGEKGDSIMAPPIVGPAGKDGRSAPTLEEVVRAIRKDIKAIL